MERHFRHILGLHRFRCLGMAQWLRVFASLPVSSPGTLSQEHS